MPKKGAKRTNTTRARASGGRFTKAVVGATAVHKEPSSRVLYIAEVVSHIFSYLDRSDHARNARVCKAWSDHALRLIWREINSLHALFSILCPLIAVSQTTGQVKQTLYGFSRLPCLEDWKRFEKYSAFVRTLSYSPSNDQSEKLLSRSVMMDISQTRPLVPILPNLQTLTWYPHLSSIESNSPTSTDSFLLMNPTVTKFRFRLHHEGVEPHIRQYLRDIPVRMPLLQEVTLDTERPISGLEEDFAHLVSGLSSLTRLLLPSYFVSLRTLDALSTLPNLHSLNIGSTLSTGSRGPLNFKPALSKERFTSLEAVSLKMHLVDAVQFVNLTNAVEGLNHFGNENRSGLASDLQKLFETLASGHTKLRSLKVMPNLSRANTDDTTLNDVILFQHLKPISRLSSLTVLKLRHFGALSMTVAELESILTSLPRLKELRLSDQPFQHRSSSFTLDVIPTIAKHCRSLTQLGVFVDATQPASPVDDILSRNIIPFPKLTSLSVGVSLITKDASHPVALYISSLLPPKCKFEYGAWWLHKMLGGSLRFPEVNARVKIWEEVGSLVDLVSKARIQDRTRAWNL